MEKFNIPFLLSGNDHTTVEHISSALDQMERHLINIVPWPAFNYRPYVAFSIAHDGSNIFLKYFVEENTVAAIYRETNGPVYKDSCVEFFIDFNDGKGYYNIEFNCAGSCHIGFGSEKEERLQVDSALIERIKYQAWFKPGSASHPDTVQWELSLIIPVDVFSHHKLNSLKEQSCRINFYKCGDELPQPHFLSWVNMVSDHPNFHLPEFFKESYFTGTDPVKNALVNGDKYIEDVLNKI